MSPACNAHPPLPATRLGRSHLHISSRSRATLATQEQTLHLLPASCSCHGSLPQHTVGHSGAQSSLFEGSEEYWPRGQETKATDRGTETVCGASGKSLPLWASASPLETLSNISKATPPGISSMGSRGSKQQEQDPLRCKPQALQICKYHSSTMQFGTSQQG